MNAIHFVDSQSSFSSSALVFNKNIKTLYTSSKLHNYRKYNMYPNTTNIIKYNLDKYFNTTFNTDIELMEYLTLDYDPN